MKLHNPMKDVHETVLAYFEGVSEGNPLKLRKALAVEVGHWKGKERLPNGTECVRVESFQESVKRWSNSSHDGCEGRLMSTEIVSDEVAVVKLVFNLDGDEYLDVLTLYKLNGEWKIVNKMFSTPAASDTNENH